MVATEAIADFGEGGVDSLDDLLGALVPEGVIHALHGLVAKRCHFAADSAGLVALQTRFDARLGFSQTLANLLAAFAADFVANPLDQAVNATTPPLVVLVLCAHGVASFD